MRNQPNIDAAQLVKDHSDYLLTQAMRKLKDSDLAKDLVQDTFVSALNNLENFEQRSSLRTWLTSILNRKIIDHWRKAETRYTDPASLFFNQEDNNGHWLENNTQHAEMKTIESEMIRQESYSILHECLDKLPAKWRGIMLAKYFDESKSTEVCKDFDLTPSNLWVIIHRAKLLLRECMQTNNP